MANVSGFVVNCLGTKSIALENRKLKYSSRQSLGTVSRYFVSRKMKWNTWPQKLATDSSSSATSRCCVAASRWVTCQLRVLVASPARDLLQLFHQATTDDRKVFGFQFLQNGTVLCSDAPFSTVWPRITLEETKNLTTCLMWRSSLLCSFNSMTLHPSNTICSAWIFPTLS